jgi:hypothetical protein
MAERNTITVTIDRKVFNEMNEQGKECGEEPMGESDLKEMFEEYLHDYYS